MAQHDYVIANGSGATVRADINSVLAAIASTNKGPTAPPAPTAGMIWVDDNTPSSSTWTIFMYDGTDWISLGTLNTTSNVFTATGAVSLADGSAAAPALSFSADPNTGLWRSGTDTVQVVGNGAAILTAAPAGVTFATASPPIWAADPSANDHLTRRSWVEARFVRGTEQATTSGGSIDFTGIPANVRQIIVTFEGVSFNGTDGAAIILGDSGGFETSGYTGNIGVTAGTSSGTIASISVGIPVILGGTAAGDNCSGVLHLFNQSGNKWVFHGQTARNGTPQLFAVSGAKTLSATLDRIRLDVDGASSFDAGSINIFWGL